MDGNRELEQLDAQARALKATLLRYLSESMLEDQGLGKLSAELTKIVQAAQRHSAEVSARSEQKVAAAVDGLRAEVRAALAQANEQIVREVRAAVNDQLTKKLKKGGADAGDPLAEQIERLQSEVRALTRSLQARGGAQPAAIDEPPPRRATQARRAPPKQFDLARFSPWQIATPLVAVLALSFGINVWQATRSDPAAGAAKPTPQAAVQKKPAATNQGVSSVIDLVKPPDPAPVLVPDAKQAAWDKVWKSALELSMQQCWLDAKSNAKAGTGTKFRDCACPSKTDSKADKEMPCEWSAKWSPDASLAALQAVLSVAAAKPMTIDAKAGAGTFNAIDLLVRDCGFKDPVFTQAVEELRTTKGKPAGSGEPATHVILSFMKKNLSACR